MIRIRRAASACAVAVVAGGLALAGAAAPAEAAVVSPAVIQPTSGATQINLVGFNDFHGRIMQADRFAANVLGAQRSYGEANTLILGNGDQFGASVFESASQQDEPSIDALNALGVESYTEGNHEFDRGEQDAVGRIAARTNGPDLAANVTDAKGGHPFGEYALFTVNGIQVAVIGAVTKDTPSLVSPDGISGIAFGDPVEAVNRVAGQLTDGDAANGEAQVIVASYHEGGPVAGSDKLAQNMANATFAHLVNDTSPKVAAIFNAHTHQAYAYETGPNGSTRPVVQADAYGASIAQVVLTVDASGAVAAHDESIIPTPLGKNDTIPAELANDPRILAIQDIMKAAKAKADDLGKEEIADQTADLTRAKICEPGSVTPGAGGVTTGCKVTDRDDRADESALGGVVANSMLDSVAATGRPVDVAMMNPGGLREDLVNDDGKVTYREAASVLPFANTISYVTLTGADLKAILEQQWQPDGAARPYLQLGLSDGFTYIYDPSLARGGRILAMSLNGQPVDLDAVYHVATPNFLAAGGDSFTAFTQASKVEDTGKIDLESFVQWVRDRKSLPVDSQRNGVLVPSSASAGAEGADAPAEPAFAFGERVAAGSSFVMGAARFDLASLGYVMNDHVTAYLVPVGSTGEGVKIGEDSPAAALPNVVAPLLRIPADTATGDYIVRLVFDNSDTVAYVPLAIDGVPGASPAPVETATPIPSNPGVDSTQIPAPTSDAATDPLARTGEDAMGGFGIAAAAVAAVLAGGAIALLRRRSAGS